MSEAGRISQPSHFSANFCFLKKINRGGTFEKDSLSATIRRYACWFASKSSTPRVTRNDSCGGVFYFIEICRNLAATDVRQSQFASLTSIRLRLRLGRGGGAVGKALMVLWFLVGCGKTAPPEVPATLPEALQWLKEGQLEAAEQVLEAYLSEHPASVTANDELRWLYFNEFRSRDVERVVRQSLQQHPGRHEFLMHALMTQFRPPLPQEGIGYLEKAQREHPNQQPVLTALGYGYWQLGRLDEARKSLNAALAVAPLDSETRLIAAEFLMEQNQPQEAGKLLKSATNSSPNLKADDRWWWLNSRLSEGENDFAHALRQIDQALKLRPFEIKYVHRRGMILQRLGRGEDAAAAFRRANDLEAKQMKLTEIVLSGELMEPTPALCEEIAALCKFRGQTLQADGWRLLSERLKTGTGPAPSMPSF